jgi:hypothetical protein
MVTREDRTLTQRQKNDVLEVLLAAGLPKSEFIWLSRESKNYSGLGVSQLEHRASRYFYIFDYAPNEYEGMQLYSYYSPGKEDRQESVGVGDWRGRLTTVGQWAKNLANELRQPDLWAVADSTDLLRSSWQGEPTNTQFSTEERREISKGLKHLLGYARETHSLTQEQLVLMEARFDYLDAATARLGRFDWRGLAITMMLTMVWEAGLDPDKARDLLDRFAELLAPALELIRQLGG